MSTQLIAFLFMIRTCEGTADLDGYSALFGYRPGNGKVFTSFADHPRIRVSYTNMRGVTITTSAAGAYQIEALTWDGVVRQIHLPDFSPASQDDAAAYLVRQRGAMPFVEQGDLERAIDRCASVWASLPGSDVDQPTRTLAFCDAAFMNSGGVLG